MRRSALLLLVIAAAGLSFLVFRGWAGEVLPPSPQFGSRATGAVAPNDAVVTSNPPSPASPSDDRTAAEPMRASVLPTEATIALTGRVTGPAGQPLGGAEVTASASPAEGYGLLDRELRADRRVAGTTTTAADGTYQLPLPAGRPFLVVARAPGLVPARRSSCRGGARVDFVLQPGAVLTGTVRRVDGGAVVAGTRIVVRQQLAGGGALPVGAATSDAAGRFRLDGLPAGSCTIDVQPRELAAPRDFEVELVAGATLVRDIELLEGLTIRGRVLDATTRRGIAGAEVGEGLLGRTVTTGDDGAFTLVGFAPLANLSLRVRAAGYGETEKLVRGQGSKPEDTATEVEVLLTKGHGARGIVLDPSGRPRAGVYVAAVAADHRGGEGNWFRSDWRSATTGDDGAFQIGDLRADLPHELLLLQPGFATTLHPFPADEAQQSEVDLGVLRLQIAAQVAGVVKDETGQPVQDHEIVLRGHNRDRWVSGKPLEDGYRAIDSYVAERHCRTDDQGRFQFIDLAAGDYTVGAQKFDSHEAISVPVAVQAGAVVTGVELVLVRGLAVEGRITVADGGALPKCYCSIDPEDGQATSGDVEAGADGAFRCGGLRAGNYRVTVYPYPSETDRAAGRSFSPFAVEHVAAGSRGLMCELVALRPVRGTVVDAQQAPVAGAWVAVFDGEREVGSATTAADGSFALPVPVGRPLWVGMVPPPRPEVGVAYRRSEVAGGVAMMAGWDPVVLVVNAR